ncbi:hypothetical protein NBO_10g0096 [Nosema bombycis CQ1]|uniref:Uncharacterized protein n=1 Tax=Nosema bombycis (strain CQ1 / CVCC 102059) TaxID=578461 RepID=R0KW17_NOSB1|nr:hypothetical protein NBO_10g0096 [Nosema bombycis CQ1]|eukprot:EOB15106.1 hypothetical protein NBO_10g0096 [Nosema bombycis CQ1]
MTIFAAMVDETPIESPDTVQTRKPKKLISPEKIKYVSKKLKETLIEIERINLKLELANDLINQLKQSELHNIFKQPILNLDYIDYELKEKALVDQLKIEDLKKIFRTSMKGILDTITQLLKIHKIISIFGQPEVKEILENSILDLFRVNYMIEDMIRYLMLPEKNPNTLDLDLDRQTLVPSYEDKKLVDIKAALLSGEHQNVDDFIRGLKNEEPVNLLFVGGTQNRLRLTFTSSPSMPIINPF